MSEDEKVEVLKEQIERLRRDETESEKLKAQIRRMGYSPDRRTW